MALERCYTSQPGRNRLAGESCSVRRGAAKAGAGSGGAALAVPLLTSGVPLIPPDRPLSPSFLLLTYGLSFLAGFAIGMAVEYANLRLRERRLACGRRRLAAQARGLRRQLLAFYRLRDEAPHGRVHREFPTSDQDDHLP